MDLTVGLRRTVCGMVLRHFRPNNGGRCLCENRRLDLVRPIVTIFISPL